MYITGIQTGYPKMSRDPRQDQEKRGTRQKESPSERKDEVEISEAAKKLLAQIASEDNHPATQLRATLNVSERSTV
jgi:hypothetical protein